MPRRRLLVFFALVTVWVLSTSTAFAQRSVIRGLVRDIAGEPISDASVTAASPISSRVVETETDDSGRFSFIGLERGRWLFTIQKRGYQPAQGFAPVRRSGNSGTVTLTMEIDLLNPPVASTGLLAGIRADDLQTEVDAAHRLFDDGEYDRAISAYQAILDQVPQWTSLNLQIGHAYREKRDFERARSSYRQVPSDTLARVEAESALRELEALAPTR